MSERRELNKAPDMGDLLEYFESRSQLLDAEGQKVLETSTLQFMSLIRFNGVPILPPVLTACRREEMMSYKHEAMRRETRCKVKKREELQAKVQSIVAGVEERRAAKQASKSSSSKSSKSLSPAARKTVEKQKPESPKLVSKGVSKMTAQTGAVTPSEIVINVSRSQNDSQSSSHTNSPQSKPSGRSSASTTKPSTSSSSKANVSSPSRTSSDPKKKEHTNYKSLGKLGHLSKQKSFSSQHLDRVGSGSMFAKYEAGSSSSSAKASSLSPKPVGLFPHPPEGRPPSRGSSMRQSTSTPDLRFIGASVKAEDLRKPLPSRNLSPKGGRPQAPERNVDKPGAEKLSRTEKSGKLPMKNSGKGFDSKDVKSRRDTTLKNKENSVDTKSKQTSLDRKNVSEKRIEEKPSPKRQELIEKDNKGVHTKSKTNQANFVLQNPLEILEQEISKEEESERFKRFEKQNVVRSEMDVGPELDPIQTATAELFPFPISEEQALATLDSLQSDFASLEQQDSLPRDYNGIPLTSLKQQQIIHMLTKLSQALNMEDTLTSTTGSNPPRVEPVRDVRGQSSKSENWNDSRSVPNGASGRDYGSNQPMEGDEMYYESSSNVTQDSATNSSSFQNTSASSAHSRARMSPTGSSSILSSASSVSASTRSRMSPKTLKNTVHFSTLVTEISTSASQSYEDKISYRKLDITPKNSENFEETEPAGVSHGATNTANPGSGHSGAIPAGLNLLGKVALSPSVDSPSGSPGGEFQNHHPFDDSHQDGELNTSDKENEFVPPPQDDSSEENYPSTTGRNMRPNRNQQVWNVYMANIPAGPIGENHPAVEKTGVKSESAETGLKFQENSGKVVLQENLTRTNQAMDTQYYYGRSNSDLERYMQGKITPEASISSLQEEITRSYLYSSQKSEKEQIGLPDGHFEIMKPVMNMNVSERSEFDMDESAVHLQPIVLTGTHNSLKENRSMLEVEEEIRSNLQRVLFDDSDEDSDDGNENNCDINKADNDRTEIVGAMVTEECDIELDEDVGNHNVNTDDEDENECDVEVDKDIGNNNNNSDGENINSDTEIIDVEHDDDVDNDDDDDDDDDYNNTDDSEISEIEDDCENEIDDKNQIADEHVDVCHNEMHEELEMEEPMKDKHEYDKVEPNLNEPIENIVVHEDFQASEQNMEITESENKVPDQQQSEHVTNGEDAQEEEAKAEHIQKYLTQVHEHSLHKEEDFFDNDDDLDTRASKAGNMMDDIGTMIQSFTSTMQSMNHLSQEELFRMQTEQFEMIQKRLIEHQQAQLEELFVAQRREQMNLQNEIEVYHTQITEKQSDIDTLMLPEALVPPMSNSPLVPQMANPLVPQMSNTLPQVTQAWQHQHSAPLQQAAMSPPFPVKPVPSTSSYYQNPNMSFNTSSSTIPYPDTRPYMDPRTLMEANIDPRSGVGVSVGPGMGFGMGMPPMGFPQDPNMSSISHNTSYSTIPHRDPGMLRGNLVPQQGMSIIQSQDLPSSSQSTNPFIYPSSPSLYMNPKDRDNVSDVSGFAKATPKQLIFSNQSTPNPPKVYKPIQHSPVKKVSGQPKQSGRYTVPEKAFSREMQPKFDRVSAAVKGYLTRRLLKTKKVRDIMKTIADTRKFAFSFQAETPIKKGTFTRADTTLLEGIVNQLQAGLMDMHEIFFMIPVSERMAIIAASRQLEEEQYIRESQRYSRESVSRSQPKLSKATLKAMERKKKAQLAEEAVFGSVEFRPKSAPPTTSSPATDISGPLQRHYHSLFVRALRPLQGHMSPIQADNQITVREMKERPKTAPDKKRLSDVNGKSKKSSGSKSSRSSTGTTSNKHKSTTSQKQTKTQTKAQIKSEKAWR